MQWESSFLKLLHFPWGLLDNLENHYFVIRRVPRLTVHLSMHYKEDEHYILCPPGVDNNNTWEIHLISKIFFPNGNFL